MLTPIEFPGADRGGLAESTSCCHRLTTEHTVCTARLLRLCHLATSFHRPCGDIVQSAILIIDDDPDIRESLGDMLLHEGYLVESAASGEDALHHATQRRFQAAILDIQLPDLNGLSVLKLLTELDASLPVIILTGNATAENTIGSLGKGAFAYLTKPYNSLELKAVLRRAVSVKGLAARAEHVEQALHASEERFRALVESATDAIVLADREGRIMWWNGAAERMFEYSKQEALEAPLTMLMPERFRAGHRNGMTRLAQGGSATLIGKTIELVGMTKAGDEFPIELALASWSTHDGVFFSGIIRNIRRRKQAEEAVVRLSHQNALILDSAGDGIFGLDLEGRATFVNATAARMLGWNAAELIGKALAPLIHPAANQPLSGPVDQFWLQTAARDGAIHRMENDMFSRRDGSTFPVQYVTSPIREQDRPVGAVVVFQDITTRKQLESLQQAQLSVSHILAQAGTLEDAIPQLLRVTAEMGLWDLALFWTRGPASGKLTCGGTWRRASAPWDEFLTLCRNSDFPPGIDFPGLAWSTKLPFWIPDVLRDARFTRTPTASRLGIRGACIIPIRTGTNIHGVLELFAGLPRASDHQLLQILTDTGMKIGQFIDRAQAGAALRATHQMTQDLLASLPGAVFLCGRDLDVQYANTLAHRYFSPTGESLVGRSLADCLILPQAAAHRLVQEWSSFSTESLPDPPERECEVAQRIYRYRCFPVTPSVSAPYQVGMVLWDITEDKQLQDQLIQSEKLTSLGTMVSGMAHEINNPAQAILSMAELIQAEQDPVTIKEFAADIVGYARHVSHVVRDFAGYARSTGTENASEIDVAERLLEAVKMARRGPHFGYVDVVTKFDAPAFLRAHKGELDQVFINLINNAVQAMNGEGRLTLGTAQDGRWIDVTITDTGPGIPAAVRPKIFDPFFTTKAPGKGTGLGLSIVHKIVSRHAGTIAVESLEGHGTTFRLRFPALSM
ncbi:MAG: PAS domain S-box protein [Nitrospira sp.]|nr:PAS domain S-box protein [Nitrospira sp.]